MKTFLIKRIQSFGYAFKGLWDLFAHHPNAQVHLLATIVVVSAGFYFGLTTMEWVTVTLCIALVIALEAVNSAIEYVVDLVSPDHHHLAGKAKDIAAAAVLVAAIGTVIVAALIFWPKIT